MVTVLTEMAERVWMVNRALVAPAGIVILLGTLARLELLRSCTTAPPAGAGLLRVTVPVAVLPPQTEVGLIVSDWSVTFDAGGLTVRVAVRVMPPAAAVIVTLVTLETGFVATMKFALVAPAGTVTLLGTVATLVLLLLRFTTNPPDGAGAVRVTVPVLLLPPTTLVGFRLRLLKLGWVGLPLTACSARYTFTRPAFGASVRPLSGW